MDIRPHIKPKTQ